MAEVLFWLLAVAVLVAGLGVAFSPKAIESVMWLFAMVLGVAGIAAVLGSPIVALLLILTYAGAIVVLFAFVAMAVGAQKTLQRIGKTRAIAAGALVVALLTSAVWPLVAGFAGNPAHANSAAGLGLLTTYFLPTQLVGWLLLWVCVGTLNIVRAPTTEEER
jgi:NADH-quinone oxidoreductase subunit J